MNIDKLYLDVAKAYVGQDNEAIVKAVLQQLKSDHYRWTDALAHAERKYVRYAKFMTADEAAQLAVKAFNEACRKGDLR